MNDQTSQLLRSERPSRRSIAIERLRREATTADLGILRLALQEETVPALRRQLSSIVRSLARSTSGSAVTDSTSLRVDAVRAEHDFVHWMRHELEPGIGWLRLAASDEVEDFGESETKLAVDGLVARMDSVEALVRASAPPRYEMLSLSELVRQALAMSPLPASRVTIDLGDGPDVISTDANLLRLVLSNAVRNALKALLSVPEEDAQVFITAGVTPETFWVKVSNRFVGSEFVLDEISGTGVSAKIGQQGQGFGIMRIVAARLDYELLMQAESGLAVFTLRGRRNSG